MVHKKACKTLLDKHLRQFTSTKSDEEPLKFIWNRRKYKNKSKNLVAHKIKREQEPAVNQKDL